MAFVLAVFPHLHARSHQQEKAEAQAPSFYRDVLRVLTLQLTNDHFVIPPGDPDFRVEARGTLPK